MQQTVITATSLRAIETGELTHSVRPATSFVRNALAPPSFVQDLAVRA